VRPYLNRKKLGMGEHTGKCKIEKAWEKSKTYLQNNQCKKGWMYSSSS
jgi:hypothetical protein